MLRNTVLSLLLMLGAAGAAQPLAQLAPKGTVLSLSMNWQGGVLDTLDDDLNALEWEKGRETLDKLLEVGAFLDDDFENVLELYREMMNGFDSSETLSPEVLEACPGLQAVADASQDYKGKGYESEALLTISLGSFSPVPAGTALLRVDDNLAPLYEQVQRTLLECAKSSDDITVTELEQEGVTLYMVGDAGDFPIVAGNVGTLYFLGTNPEVVRGVVRRAQGAAEPSFADTPFYRQANTKLAEAANGLGFSLNFVALANLLQGVAGFMGSESATTYLLSRTDALLRTLGGFAGTLGLTDEGVRLENVLAVNPEGGDRALLELLLCETCTVSAPFLAPEGSVGVSAQYLPWRELWTYIQDWASGLEAVTGESLDVEQLVQDAFGLDLDAALFDWLGSEVQTYTLESVGPDLRTLVYGPSQVSIIPVSSPAAAEAGLDALGRTFGPILNNLLSGAGGMDVSGVENLFGASSLLGEPVVSSYDYKDTTVTRLRAGLNTDLGYTFVGNYLVVGHSRAVEQIVDTFEGGRSLAFDSNFRALRAELPTNLSSFSYSDIATNLNGLADLLEVFIQPAAFAATAGLKGAIADAADMSATSDLGYADLYEVTPERLEVPGNVQGTLSEADEDAYGTFTAYHELVGLAPGARVSVSLSSDAFDTYLSLIDADAEIYLAENDDGENSVDSELEFTAEAGRRYLLEVTSYDGLETGDYSLSVRVEEGAGSATEVEAELLAEADLPTFRELLNLLDLVPESLRILADHTSTSVRYSEVDGDTVYTRYLTRVRW